MTDPTQPYGYQQPIVDQYRQIPPPIPQPPAKKKAPTWFIVLFFIVIIGACTGGGIAVFSHSSTTSPSTTSTLSVSQKLAAWRSGGGQDILTSITADLGSMQTAGQNVDSSAMNNACVALQQDVETAHAYAPIPIASAQRPYSAALAQFARASDDCIAGVSTQDAALISKATKELSAGSTDIKNAAAALNTVTGG